MTVEELAAKRERERLSKLTPRARELGRASKKRQYSDPLFRKKRKDYVAAWSQTPGTQARLKETKKAYHQRPEVKARIRAYTSERRSSDPAYKALHAARVRLRGVLKLAGETKSVKTLELLGCTASELKEHIESQFSPGMNWSNHGSTGWHIDHIKPCASFDLSDPAQQRACFHFSNLQPLWWLENLKKGAS